MRKLADGSGSERRADAGFERIIESMMAFDGKVDRLSRVLDELTAPGIPAKLDDDDSLIIALRDYANDGDIEAFLDEQTLPR
jgi:hypothetical protein